VCTFPLDPLVYAQLIVIRQDPRLTVLTNSPPSKKGEGRKAQGEGH
jgi:hypothetical protein